MGYARSYAKRMNLAAMAPRDDLSSSTYCLANPGKEYLVYLPDGGEVTVDLSDASGTAALEWMGPDNGVISQGGTVMGGAKQAFKAPFGGDAVLYIRFEQ